MSRPVRVLVLGASGRLGAMLRRYWGGRIAPCWQARRPVEWAGAAIFDPLGSGPAEGPFDIVLGLAGVVGGTDDALRLNTDLALAAVGLGARTGARHVFLSSSAAVYGNAGGDLTEQGPTRPATAYGVAKQRMEDEALARAAVLGVPVTALRIGNVAGADALLGQAGARPVLLDRFPDGQGPRRSYVGPQGFADVLARLVVMAAGGQSLPAHLNVALPGIVAMEGLLRAASIGFEWRTAPADAVPQVGLDVSRLTALIPLPEATPAGIVQDWRGYGRAAA